jgi:CHAT domain-containing protein
MLLRAQALVAQEINYWNTFYSGNISGAIAQTNRVLTEDDNEQNRIFAAIAQFEFCTFTFDRSACLKPGFTHLSTVVSALKPEDQNFKWLNTELQNALIANSMHYEEMRDGFRQTRFEHINYFKLGDGFLTNYLNAQYALALAAREEGQLTYAREVVTRLLYLLSTLDQKAETNYLKGQILSQIIIISNEIGDLYTARKFYDLADEFIIKNIYHLRPYAYRYLSSTSQLLAASKNLKDQEGAIGRVLMAKSILDDGNFDNSIGLIEHSMLQTMQIFMAMRMHDWAQAKYLYLSHPLYDQFIKGGKSRIESSHEMYFAGTAYLLYDSNIIPEEQLPLINPSEFDDPYIWEDTYASGTLLKFTRLIAKYVNSKKSEENGDGKALREAFNFLLDQLLKDQNPTSTLASQPAFYFYPLIEYYSLEALRSGLQISWSELAHLADAINREPSQIYGDFLSFAPPENSSGYFAAHTLFDLTSNRLRAEIDVISSVLRSEKVGEFQQDSLVKINSSIQALAEKSQINWNHLEVSPYIETNIKNNEVLIFGFELEGFVNLFCTDGLRLWNAKRTKFSDLHEGVSRLKEALGSSKAFSQSWENFPYGEARQLGQILLGENFRECLKIGDTISFVPFSLFRGLPLEVLLTEEYTGPYKTAPWALREYAFTYSSSIKEAFKAFQDDELVVAEKFFGLANPVFSASDELTELSTFDADSSSFAFGTRSIGLTEFTALPETDEEIAQISALFPEATIFSQSHATERNIRSIDLSSYDVMSFATHGALSFEASGLTSPSLILSFEPRVEGQYNSKKIDGILTAEEISRMNLSASLVSLSACNTATNDINSSSRNVQNLASAFRLAGVDNVLSSLWAVESDAAVYVNSQFHKRWLNTGRSVAQALQRAKLDFLFQIDDERASPAFWAAMINVGSGRGATGQSSNADQPYTLNLGVEPGVVSGVAALSNGDLLVSKNLQRQPQKLSPVLSKLNIKTGKTNEIEAIGDIYGSLYIDDIAGRNISWSLTYKEFNAVKFATAPLVSEFDDNGNLVWEYQYPLDPGVIIEMSSVSVLPNGSVFAFLHKSEELPDSTYKYSLIGVSLDKDGDLLNETLFHETFASLPLNKSYVVAPPTEANQFKVIINFMNLGRDGYLMGDLGERFLCSEPEAMIFFVDIESMQVFASDTIKNLWVESAIDTSEVLYLSGSRSEKCRFDMTLGGVPTIVKYDSGAREVIYEDHKFFPAKVVDISVSDEKVQFAQIWRPSVVGVQSRDFDEISENSDELWNHERPTQYEDSVYTFHSIGEIAPGQPATSEFLRVNNFWSEGASIDDNSVYFYGKLGSKAGMIKADFAK